MKYYIITDTHFGHQKLVEVGMRPDGFENLIMKDIRRHASLDTILICLGDIAFRSSDFWNKLITSEKYHSFWLIKGNHDKYSDTKYFKYGWDFVGNEARIKHNGYNIAFSHKPIDIKKDFINIFGHFHNSSPEIIKKYELNLWKISQKSNHILLALEKNHYQGWYLDTILKIYRKKNNEKIQNT